MAEAGSFGPIFALTYIFITGCFPTISCNAVQSDWNSLVFDVGSFPKTTLLGTIMSSVIFRPKSAFHWSHNSAQNQGSKNKRVASFSKPLAKAYMTGRCQNSLPGSVWGSFGGGFNGVPAVSTCCSSASFRCGYFFSQCLFFFAEIGEFFPVRKPYISLFSMMSHAFHTISSQVCLEGSCPPTHRL